MANNTHQQTFGYDDLKQPPLSREALLRLDHDSPVRAKAIIELADRLFRDSPYANFRFGPSPERAEVGPEYCDAVYAALANAGAEWSTSQDALELKTRLTDVVKRKRLVGVRNIVCFGLGAPEFWGKGEPFTNEAKAKGHGNRSLIQHVAALWMADVITEASENKEEVQVYAQDPEYRLQDVAPFAAHGIQVLDAARHEGLVKIGTDSLVFLMGAGTHVIRAFAETTRPAGIICTLMRVNQDTNGAHATLKLLDSEYDEYVDWPPFTHPLVHTHVYGTQGMRDLAKDGLRPLQGGSVRLLKPKFLPYLATVLGRWETD